MTENEAIKHLEHIIWCMGDEPPQNIKNDRDIKEWEDEHKKIKKTYEVAIQALEEIQQYRAIGTIEEFKRAKEMEAVYGQVKWERDIAISQLEEIGVGLGQKMDEFKALKEKSVAKKVVFVKNMMTKEKAYYCPSCKRIVESVHIHCWSCGQKLDWE